MQILINYIMTINVLEGSQKNEKQSDYSGLFEPHRTGGSTALQCSQRKEYYVKSPTSSFKSYNLIGRRRRI